MSKRHKQFLSMVAACAVALMAEGAYARSAAPGPCLTNDDGSGQCAGTLEEIVASGAFYGYAGFTLVTFGDSVLGFFYAYVDGDIYSCYQDLSGAQPSAAAIWAQAAAHRGYLTVRWDADGLCRQLFLVNTAIRGATY